MAFHPGILDRLKRLMISAPSEEQKVWRKLSHFRLQGLQKVCSYQTLSHFFPQHCSLHPWSPNSTAHCTLGPQHCSQHPWSTALLTAPLVTKTCMPDKRVCLACLPSFRPGRWLRGSGQALSLNFYITRLRVRPGAPPPSPPLPLTPQGCLICKSGSLCKFWGRGVRWAGLRALV